MHMHLHKVPRGLEDVTVVPACVSTCTELRAVLQSPV